MDAKATWLSSYAAQKKLHVLEVVKETSHFRPDYRGFCIFSAHCKHPSATVVIADAFDAVASRRWTVDRLKVLVIGPERVQVSGQRVVTLVHGTFFPNAEWTQTSSNFSNDLRKHLLGVVLRRFQWSGENSPSARHQASFKLLFYLEAISNEFPDCEHYVVAHSHGGSVALYCLQNGELQPFVAGAICLNTPFLQYSLRDLEPLIFAAGGSLGIFAIVLIGTAFGPFVGLFVGGALLLTAISYSQAFACIWKEDAESWIARLKTEAPAVPLLWVRNQDQLPPYLRAIALTTALPAWVWQIWATVTAVLAIGGMIVLLVLFVLPSMIWFAFTFNISLIPGAKVLTDFVEQMTISSIMWFMAAPLAMLVVLFASLGRRWFAFGSVGFADLFISVKTSDDPPAHSKCDRLSVKDSKGFWHSILHFQHSRLYDNPLVAAQIAAWIGSNPKPADSEQPMSSVIQD